MLEEYFPEFITVTCIEWLPLISKTNEKEIIVQSLQSLARDKNNITYTLDNLIKAAKLKTL